MSGKRGAEPRTESRPLGALVRLAEELDQPQLVELVFVIGTYTCLAMAFNSFELELDPDLRAVEE